MDILRLLSEFRTPVLDKICLAITYLGSGVFFLVLVCLLFWCVDKKLAYKLVFVSVVSSIFVQTIKIIAKVPRPWVLDKSFQPADIAKPTATGYSFPSGHSAQATATSITLATATTNVLIKAILYIVMVSIIFSRMYLGVHTPLDVSVGFIISLIVALLINYYANNYELSDKTITIFKIFIILAVIASFSYTLYLWIISTDVSTKDLKDVSTICGLSLGTIIGHTIETKYIKFNEKAASLPIQILKYIIGVTVLAIFHLTVNYILDIYIPTFLPAYFAVYLIDTLYVTCIYPIIIKKYFTNPYIF